MSAWDLMGLFYELGDGVCWVSQNKRAGFSSQKSADAFKKSAPDWSVFWVKSQRAGTAKEIGETGA